MVGAQVNFKLGIIAKTVKEIELDKGLGLAEKSWRMENLIGEARNLIGKHFP